MTNYPRFDFPKQKTFVKFIKLKNAIFYIIKCKLVKKIILIIKLFIEKIKQEKYILPSCDYSSEHYSRSTISY